jgi:3-methyladenine DNA glycosylase/8-oxoguanine DNA glycosylase
MERSSTVRAPARFDFGWTVRFLTARVVPAMERVTPGEYRRSARVDGALLTLAVRVDAAPDGAPLLHVRTAPALPSPAAVALVTRMFDLDADVEAFAALAAEDALLAPLVRRTPHLRLPQLIDPFEGAVRAVLGQQVSVQAASTMTDRLVRLIGEEAPALDGERPFGFPTPEQVARAGEGALGGIGLTRAKAASVVAVARAVLDGTIDWDALRAAPWEDAARALTAVRGIGPWTASYLRMRVLGDRDAFPASDLGVVKALRALAGIERPADGVALAERWRPWRGYATLHLWESLSANAAPRAVAAGSAE